MSFSHTTPTLSTGVRFSYKSVNLFQNLKYERTKSLSKWSKGLYISRWEIYFVITQVLITYSKDLLLHLRKSVQVQVSSLFSFKFHWYKILTLDVFSCRSVITHRVTRHCNESAGVIDSLQHRLCLHSPCSETICH